MRRDPHAEEQLTAMIVGLADQFRQAGQFVPARLHSAMGLVEKLRDLPSLDAEDHWTVGSAGIIQHESFAKRAFERHQVLPTLKTFGRRSSEVREWGPKLLSCFASVGFQSMESDRRDTLLDAAQGQFVQWLQLLAADAPIRVRLARRSVSAVVGDIIALAFDRRCAGPVAQYLVAAKLEARFSSLDLPRRGANHPDKNWDTDPSATLGDFLVGSTVVEVAIGRPDEKHLTQVARALGTTSHEVWLIVRSDRREAWLDELRESVDDIARVTVLGINEFIGQNIAEIGGLDRTESGKALRAMIASYNTKWASGQGSGAVVIEILD